MAAFSITDFTTLPADFSLIGAAVINIDNGSDETKVLRLVASTQSFDCGAIEYGKKIGLQSFACTIKFRITSGADGFHFVLHNDPPIADATFPARIISGLAPSVFFQVDTYTNTEDNDPSASHVGINEDGSFISLQTANISPALDNNSLRTLYIEYANQHVDISVDGSVKLQRDIDIASKLGTNDAYTFIEGMTGGVTSNHDIIEWSLEFAPLSVGNALMFSCNT